MSPKLQTSVNVGRGSITDNTEGYFQWCDQSSILFTCSIFARLVSYVTHWQFRMKTYLLIVLLALLDGGCSSTDKAFQKVPLDEVFTLSHGAWAKVDDRFTLTFDSVAEDSRCPTGTQCVWEGNGAAVLLYESPDSSPLYFRLNTAGKFQQDTVIQHYRITLVELLPQAEVNRNLKQSDYQLKLKVERE
jgi:hypothetical protein